MKNLYLIQSDPPQDLVLSNGNTIILGRKKFVQAMELGSELRDQLVPPTMILTGPQDGPIQLTNILAAALYPVRARKIPELIDFGKRDDPYNLLPRMGHLLECIKVMPDASILVVGPQHVVASLSFLIQYPDEASINFDELFQAEYRESAQALELTLTAQGNFTGMPRIIESGRNSTLLEMNSYLLKR